MTLSLSLLTCTLAGAAPAMRGIIVATDLAYPLAHIALIALMVWGLLRVVGGRPDESEDSSDSEAILSSDASDDDDTESS